MSKNDGGRAFPNALGADGMTLRDFFAAAALTGLLQQKDLYVPWYVSIDRAADAYRVADAMIAARDK